MEIYYILEVYEDGDHYTSTRHADENDMYEPIFYSTLEAAEARKTELMNEINKKYLAELQKHVEQNAKYKVYQDGLEKRLAEFEILLAAGLRDEKNRPTSNFKAAGFPDFSEWLQKRRARSYNVYQYDIEKAELRDK